MKRLLQIEWLKLRHYRPFWILVGLYGLLSVLIISSVRPFLAFLSAKGANYEGIDLTIIPFYDFPDVWQNITYIATFLKVFLAFIIIISVNNEITNKTLRQGIIDGMSKKDWLQSKLLLIGSLSLGATVLLFLTGLITGLLYSHPHGYSEIFVNTEFLLTYALEVFTYATFALLITLIVRRTGLVMVGLLMYTFAFEPFIYVLLTFPPNEFDFPEWTKSLPPFFPVRALNNLIHVPFQKYALQEYQDYVSIKETLIVIGWLIFNVGCSYWILRRRDL
ncbi:MAG: ABC transporter permease subunit [Bacteroidota bacterium]